MTRKEWMEQHHPWMVDSRACGGVLGCPNSYADLVATDKSIKSDVDCSSASRYYSDHYTGESCQSCWNREMEVPKK